MKINCVICSIALFVTLPLIAQRNVQSFLTMTPESIIEEYGQPVLYDQVDLTPCYTLEYSDFYICYAPSGYGTDQMSLSLCSFYTKSTDFILLPDKVNGGIRVGANISDMTMLGNTPYARNKTGNALRKTTVNERFEMLGNGILANYIVYAEEQMFILLYVENDIIQQFAIETVSDANNDMAENMHTLF